MDDEKGKILTVPGWLELRVSIGNIVTVVSVLVGGGIYYARMDGRVAMTELNQAKTELIYVRKDVAEQEQRFLSMRLEDMKAQMDRVEKKIDSMK
jgi:hypothetical protein